METLTIPEWTMADRLRKAREAAGLDQQQLADRIDIFPGRHPGQHVSPNWVGEVLSRLLGPGASAHSLRHRYATRIYGATHDLLAVQQLLGHSSPVTTQVYVRRELDDLRRAARAAS